MRYLRYSDSTYNNLNQNGKHKFAQSHALEVYVPRAIYSFIPKNACSTLRLSLALANGCIKDPSDIHWIHKNNNTFQADLRSLLRAEYTFTVLRCPFARLASVYLDKIVSRDTVAWHLYDLINRRKSIDHLSFREFVSELKHPSVLNGNIHWRPQIQFLVYGEYDDYFSVERFGHAVKTLKDKIDLDVVDARLLTLHGNSHLEKIGGVFSDASALEIYGLKAEGKCPEVASLYDDELINLVKNLYRHDIRLYEDIFGAEDLMFS